MQNIKFNNLQHIPESVCSYSHSWYEWYFSQNYIGLNDGVPSSLLNITSSVLSETNLEGSLCFADRLENVPGGDFDLGVKELENNGWQMKDWCPKPGLARHMGSAKLL